MSSNNGYDNREPDSQVRSIIKQLNEERPSKEKSREVVVRADGTKVIRVVKKRKVMISNEEKAKKTKRRVVFTLLGCFVLLGLLVGFFSLRMAMMSSDSYIKDQEAAIGEAWGAQVRLQNAKVSGFTLTADRLVAEFPESSMLERVELKNIKASLSAATFFSGILQGEKLEIGEGVMVVRENADRLKLPAPTEKKLWNFERFHCASFTMTVGSSVESPFAVRNATVDIYRTNGGGASLSVLIKDGKLEVEGLNGGKPVVLDSGKVLLSDAAVEEFSLECHSDHAGDSGTPQLKIAGRLDNGASLVGPYLFQSENLGFEQIGGHAFKELLSGVTNDMVGSLSDTKSLVSLPFGGAPLAFSGTFNLKNVSVKNLAAPSVLMSHLKSLASPVAGAVDESNGQVQMQAGSQIVFRDVTLTMKGGKLTLSQDTTVDKVCINGEISVVDNKELSGNVKYGVLLTEARKEYKENSVDPIYDYGDSSDKYVWFVTSVSGPCIKPRDNAVELNNEKEARRAELSLTRANEETTSKVRSIEEIKRNASSRNNGRTPAKKTELPPGAEDFTLTTDTVVAPDATPDSSSLPPAEKEEPVTPGTEQPEGPKMKGLDDFYTDDDWNTGFDTSLPGTGK